MEEEEEANCFLGYSSDILARNNLKFVEVVHGTILSSLHGGNVVGRVRTVICKRLKFSGFERALGTIRSGLLRRSPVFRPCHATIHKEADCKTKKKKEDDVSSGGIFPFSQVPSRFAYNPAFRCKLSHFAFPLAFHSKLRSIHLSPLPSS